MSECCCIFCFENALVTFKKLVYETDLNYAVHDSMPSSKGHLLIIPKKHYLTWLQAPTNVLQDACVLITKMQHHLISQFKPDGFNIGINSGEAAGQSVYHMHIHIIPRYKGDHPSPKGGVRAVLPGTLNYLS